MNGSSQTARDRRIPYYFVAFFVVIALVDGAMVTMAIRTQTGLVTDHAYEKGLAYNQVVAAAGAQEKLGWQGDISFKQSGPGSLSGILGFHLRDKEGQGLALEAIHAKFIRPTQDGMDFAVEMDGLAEKTVSFPVPGLWEVRIFARHAGVEFQQAKRVVVE